MTVILVLLTIAVVLLVDWLINGRRLAAMRDAQPAVAEPTAVRLPRGVFFAPSHTWLNILPSGRAFLGVDDFVTRLADKPRLLMLKEAGARVARGEPLLALEDGERRLTVRSPLDAMVLEVNSESERLGAAHKAAPLCDSWACQLLPDRPQDLKALLLGDEADSWMQAELRRLRDFFASASPALSPAMLQDGGQPVAGAMKHASRELWQRFEDEFLAVGE